jgi:hypothetical protein
MITSVLAFERPVDRAAEFLGAPGAVRFLDLPARRCVMIDGDGEPGSGSFAPRMPGLYATAYKLHFILKERRVQAGVNPLEGLWWTAEDYIGAIGRPDRNLWNWTLLIGLPDEATDDELESALATGRTKLDPTLAHGLRIERFDEGRVAQILHVGPYAAERTTIDHLHQVVAEAGLTLRGRHHEIYLGDPRQSAPERLRTLIRHPVA